MKKNCFNLARGLLNTTLMGLFSVLSLQAQTFSGQSKLSEIPGQLEAVIFPIKNRPEILKLIYRSRKKGVINVEIRNETGSIVYQHLEPSGLNGQNIDMSGMPAGTYTIELNNRHESFSQQFTIEPPIRSHITLVKPKYTPEIPVEKKLIVSY